MDKRKQKTRIVFDKKKNPSMTKQEFKDDCNINKIVAKFMVTHDESLLQKNTGVFMDTTQIPDYQEALNQVILAETMFNEMPSDIRKQFENNPSKFVEFCQNPNNYEQLIQLGLAEPTEAYHQMKAKQNAQDTKNDKLNDEKPSSAKPSVKSDE